MPRSAEPPRGQGALLECVLYAYGHPQALRLQVCPGASSKPRCPLRTFSHRAAQEAHGPTRPGPLIHLLLQGAEGVSVVPTHFQSPSLLPPGQDGELQ